MNSESLYNKIVELGIEHSNHESDLYIPVTDETRTLIDAYEYSRNVTIFKNQINGNLWYDVPFAYLPFWNKRLVKV